MWPNTNKETIYTIKKGFEKPFENEYNELQTLLANLITKSKISLIESNKKVNQIIKEKYENKVMVPHDELPYAWKICPLWLKKISSLIEDEIKKCDSILSADHKNYSLDQKIEYLFSTKVSEAIIADSTREFSKIIEPYWNDFSKVKENNLVQNAATHEVILEQKYKETNDYNLEILKKYNSIEEEIICLSTLIQEEINVEDIKNKTMIDDDHLFVK